MNVAPRGRVLIIDDDSKFLERMAASFCIAGHDVSIALGGVAGLLRFEETQPQLLITDIAMPERDGIETIIAVRRIDPWVKIIAINNDPYFLELARNLGADATFVKPFAMEDLLDTAATLLSARGVH